MVLRRNKQKITALPLRGAASAVIVSLAYVMITPEEIALLRVRKQRFELFQ